MRIRRNWLQREAELQMMQFGLSPSLACVRVFDMVKNHYFDITPEQRKRLLKKARRLGWHLIDRSGLPVIPANR